MRRNVVSNKHMSGSQRLEFVISSLTVSGFAIEDVHFIGNRFTTFKDYLHCITKLIEKTTDLVFSH